MLVMRNVIMPSALVTPVIGLNFRNLETPMLITPRDQLKGNEILSYVAITPFIMPIMKTIMEVTAVVHVLCVFVFWRRDYHAHNVTRDSRDERVCMCFVISFLVKFSKQLISKLT